MREFHRIVPLLAAVFIAFLASPVGADAPLSGERRSGKIENFLLPDHEGKSHELYRQSKARAVVLIFTITGCPIIEKSTPTIKALRDEFASKGIVFWLVDSNTDDDSKAVKEEVRNFAIDLPVLLDNNQNLARSLDARRTAEAFCIDTKSWTIFYRGAIDDRLGYGTEKPHASHPFLQNALNSFLAGKKIKPARTEVKGCLIHFENK
jgi:peroxiredoxin